MPEDPQSAMDHLLRVLTLRATAPDRFQADTEQEEGRLFGGIVLAQSVVAAGSTVSEGIIHSMHGYFLRAGRPARPIDYTVERIRDGRNFTGRRVSAYQDGTDMIDLHVAHLRHVHKPSQHCGRDEEGGIRVVINQIHQLKRIETTAGGQHLVRSLHNVGQAEQPRGMGLRA